MNTVSRWWIPFRLLQNRLSREATQIVWARTLNAHIHTRYGVSRNAHGNVICNGPRSSFTPILLKVQSIPHLWSLRSLSTSDALRGIFSRHSNKPPDNTLIYTGPLSSMVKMVKLFSLSTSGISLVILQLLFLSSEAGAMKILGGSMACMLFMTPLALHWITKTYVTQIYFDHATDTFTSYTVSFFLASIRQDFKPDDVETPAVRNLMTSVVVKGRPLLIDPRAFVHPNHYSHLMGYDKIPEGISVEDIKSAMDDMSDSDAEEDQRKDR